MGGASSFCKSPIQTCCGFLRKEDAVVGGGGACYGRRMNGKELFSHAIGVRPPWEVKEVRMDMKAQRVEVEVECTQTVWADPTTRQRLHLHGSFLVYYQQDAQAEPINSGTGCFREKAEGGLPDQRELYGE